MEKTCNDCIYMQDPLLTNDITECWLNDPVEVDPCKAQDCADYEEID